MEVLSCGSASYVQSRCILVKFALDCPVFLGPIECTITFAAERRQSMGFDWHRECLKCQECGKVLNPGQHAEVSYNMALGALSKESGYSTRRGHSVTYLVIRLCLVPSCLGTDQPSSPIKVLAKSEDKTF